MAGSVNKVIIVGNLGSDPEIRTTPSGQTVATLSIATSENFSDREGQRQERTEWHRVVLWNRLAELAQRYLSKGRKVYIEGRIQTRSWDDKQTGQKRYSTEIIAKEMTFLDTGTGQRSGNDQSSGGYGQGSSPQGGAPAAPARAPVEQAPPGAGGGFSAPNAGATPAPAGGGFSAPNAGATPAPAGGGDPGYYNDDDIPF